VNAPEAGIIKEFLANEEDTVTVGQDLVRIELGGAPSGDKPAAEAKETPKEESKPETQPEQKKAPEPKPEEAKPAPAKEEAPAPKQPSKPAPAAAAEAPATLGNREERRVGR
jgi:2-oxoglutarate dehydrogenase E2 component (dihydrolipoamide succinyltransferase)